MRSKPLMLTLMPLLATSFLAAMASQNATPAPVKARLALTPELREFRKTAIRVQSPSSGLTLHGWIYKPTGAGPFPAVIWDHGSEPQPTAHTELGKFYTSHGYVLFLPIRHGPAPSPGEYSQDVIDRYR